MTGPPSHWLGQGVLQAAAWLDRLKAGKAAIFPNHVLLPGGRGRIRA